MKVRVDKVAGAAYITLVKEIGKGEVKKSVHFQGRDEIILDFDKEGHLLGIELLNLDRLHPDLKNYRKRVPHDKHCYCPKCMGC